MHALRLLVVAVLFVAQVSFMASRVAAAETVSPWFAFHTKRLDALVVSDSVSAAPRNLVSNWSMDIGRPLGDPAWNAALRVTTPISPADLSFSPPMSYDAATQTFSRAGTTSTMFTQVFGNPQVTNETTSPGFSASRALEGGRFIAAGATVAKTLDITATPTAEARSLIIEVSSGFSPSPVTVLLLDCPGASFGRWVITSPAVDAPITRSCTLTLWNATASPANYMPLVKVTVLQGIQRTSTLGGTSFTVADTLGTTTLEVQPPPDDTVIGHLDQWQEKRVTLWYENAATVTPTQDWTGSLSRLFSARTTADAIANGVPLLPSWGMTITAFDAPAPLPAEIQLTTPLAESQLFRFPDAPAVPVPGGVRYTWSGMTPFFTASVTGRDITIDSPLGFNGDRALSGGRLVPAHSSASRTLTIRTQTIDPMLSLTVAAEFGTPPGLGIVVSGISCPGSGPIGGSPDGRAWRLDAPTPGTDSVFTCTMTIANNGDADVLYMPWVNLWSDRSFTFTAPVLGADTQQTTTPLLGTIDYRVEVPAGTVPRATLSEIDIRTATLELVAQLSPRATTLEALTTGTYPFGFVPPLQGRLTDVTTGAPLADQTIHFALEHGGTTLFTADAVTDASGIATVPTPSLPPAQDYRYRITFDGTAAYLASTDEGSFTVVNSIGHVTGAFHLPSGARGVLVAHSSSAGLNGEFQFVTSSQSYSSTEILALGISADRSRAVVLTTDAADVRALLAIQDNGPSGALDRISIVIGSTEQNPTEVISSGNLQIIP